MSISVTSFSPNTVISSSDMNTNFSNLTGAIPWSSSPISSSGDILYASSATVMTRLPVGSAGQVLSVSGGLPTWLAAQTSHLSVVSKTSGYAASASDDLILCSGAAFNVTLPDVSANSGKVYTITKTDSNTSNIISIIPTGSNVFGPSSNTSIKLEYLNESVTVISDGSNTYQIISIRKNPRITKYTSGSGTFTTYATPTPAAIRVLAIGAGGGGGGSGQGSFGTGTSGGDTTFGSALISAGGGNAGSGGSGTGGPGGTASLGSGPVGLAIPGTGGQGGASTNGSNASSLTGGNGGGTMLSPGGGGGGQSSNGYDAPVNSGAGGGGGGTNSNTGTQSGCGAGAGGSVDAIIYGPAATYPYAVGAKGTKGTAGTNGQTGGDGADGILLITELFG